MYVCSRAGEDMRVLASVYACVWACAFTRVALRIQYGIQGAILCEVCLGSS